MPHPSETELDNMLVCQKDDIIKDIDDGYFDRARAKLTVVFQLWDFCGYNYKFQELQVRLTSAFSAQFQDRR